MVAFFRRSGTPIFVWGAWTLLLAAALLYVHRYGTNVPSWDDWDIVPTMTGEQPVTAEWLWSQHNEHRIPVARLMMLATYRVWPDFRSTMVLNVLSMAWLAFALTRCAQHLRGKLGVTDLFFPLVLLGLAQGVNFIWGWQVEFMSSTAVAGLALFYIARYNQSGNLRTAIAFGCCLIVLALSGAHGMVLVPALSLWLIVLAWWGEPSGSVDSRRNRLIILAICIVCIACCVLYMVGYERVPHHPKSSGLHSAFKGTLQFLTMAFGPAVQSVWPWSGLLTAALLGGTAIILITVMLRNRSERVRAAGHLCFFAALGCLAFAVGYGRDTRGFEPRYITLSAPILCSIYLALVTYLPARWSSAGCAALAVVALAATPGNTKSSVKYGRELRNALRTFDAQMAAGTPPYALIQQHWQYLYPQQQLIADYLPMLRKAHIGSFSKLVDDPPFQEVPVLTEPVTVHKMVWRGSTAHTSDWDSYAVFQLPQEMVVAGIRIAYNATNQRRVPPCVKIGWRGETQRGESTYTMWPTGDRANWERGSWVRIGQLRTEKTVWIRSKVREIRLYPDVERCVFHLQELVLLVPKPEEAQHDRRFRTLPE